MADAGDRGPGGPAAGGVTPLRAGASTERAAAELYRHDPATFARHRDALAARLQSAGDELGAARIRRLPVPTTAAWWVNQLAGRWPNELAALLDLGHELREAAERRDPVRLTDLDRTRRVRTDALLSLLWHHGAEVEGGLALAGQPTPGGGGGTGGGGQRRHVEPAPEELTLVLETVTAAVLDDEVAQVVRAGCVAQTVEAPDIDLLRRGAGGPANAREGVAPVAALRADRHDRTDALALASAAVVDAENRLAAASDTVTSLTGMLEGLEQELTELARDRDSTRSRLETWRRAVLEVEGELRAARARLDRLT